MIHRGLRGSGDAGVTDVLPGTPRSGRRTQSSFQVKIVGLVVCLLLAAGLYFAAGTLGNALFGEPEETPAELRERFARVYKERNELRQQVETLSKVEAQLKTAQVIKKQQHKKIERLEQDLVLFNQLQTQGVQTKINQLENDNKVLKHLNEQLKETVQECIEAGKI